VGEVRFYEGVKFLGAVDLDVGDVGVGVGEVEVLVGWGWGLVFCHCGWGAGLYVGLCTVVRCIYWYRALHVIYQGETDGEWFLFVFVSRGGLRRGYSLLSGPRLWPDAGSVAAAPELGV